MVGRVVKPGKGGVFKRRKGFLLFVGGDGRVREMSMKRRGKTKGR